MSFIENGLCCFAARLSSSEHSQPLGLRVDSILAATRSTYFHILIAASDQRHLH
jgi:hypothetical protein